MWFFLSFQYFFFDVNSYNTFELFHVHSCRTTMCGTNLLDICLDVLSNTVYWWECRTTTMAIIGHKYQQNRSSPISCTTRVVYIPSWTYMKLYVTASVPLHDESTIEIADELWRYFRKRQWILNWTDVVMSMITTLCILTMTSSLCQQDIKYLDFYLQSFIIVSLFGN